MNTPNKSKENKLMRSALLLLSLGILSVGSLHAQTLDERVNDLEEKIQLQEEASKFGPQISGIMRGKYE